MKGYLLLLLGLVALAVPISVVYLLVSHQRLKTRVAELESHIYSGEDFERAPQAGCSDEPDIPEPKNVRDDVHSTPDITTASPNHARDETSVLRPSSTPLGTASSDATIFSNVSPKSYVFRSDVAKQAAAWIAQNWYLAVAAVSLALAGVFLVQYGVEEGLLTPFWRVMGGVTLGVTLIVGGEVVRRRWGDEAGSHTAFLPSTFAGAGLVTLFVAVVAARQLYDLIGPDAAFAAMAAISVCSVILGWFYGPFLTITGILGATMTPFIVGGSSDTPQIFFYYFALIAVAGLLIDAARRWAWTSVVAILATHGTAWVIFTGGAGDIHYLGFALIIAMAAVIIPPLKWRPTHSGPTVLQSLLHRGLNIGWPKFSTRLATGAFAGAIVVTVLVAVKDAGAEPVWGAIAAISALYLLATLWNRRAPALTDLTVIAPVAFALIIIQQGETIGTLLEEFSAPPPPEGPWPKHVTVLSMIALAMSVIAFWRASDGSGWRMIWTSGSALFAPLVLVSLEIWWHPTDPLGAGLWAVHPMIVAAVMTLFSERCARSDGEDKRRAAVFALSALTMIAFALIVMLSDTALSIALSVMVLLAALLDRWLKMPYLAIFVNVGSVTVGWRLILDPGVMWAIEIAPLWELWLGYGGAILLLSAAWVVLAPLQRISAKVTLESAIWMLIAIFSSVLIYRTLGARSDTHWGTALIALVGLIAMGGQLYRLRSDRRLRMARAILASLYAVWGFGGLYLIFAIRNPLEYRREIILGPPVFDTLLVTFALPALLLALFAWKFDHLPRPLRLVFSGLSAGLSINYVALEIRRAWRGDILAVPGTTGPELYSYTVAMLVAAIVLLFVAFSRRSISLRRIAVVGVALTIAKVFLVDMSGLVGLVRVASFLGLGLSLAGLAWINRQMTEQWDKRQNPD